MLLSAVIPFRNRDPRRLEAAIRSIASYIDDDSEIIISDYGSDDPSIADQVARKYGATVVYTVADHWSRSASLNAGFAAARGEIFLGADADIIWGPGSIEVASQSIKTNPDHCIAFECQFMGHDVDIEDVLASGGTDWERYDRSSRLNPRWGVGMLFFPRRGFEATNGYESRMKTYGYEDNDFSLRLRAAGYPIRWIGGGEERAYHVWHEPVGQIAKSDSDIQRDYDANRELFASSRSVVRNAVGGSFSSRPLVSVAIATKDRADLLEVALSSILCQSVRDFEVVVVDDGSSDHTRSVVEGFGDERLRYFRQESAGISVARNAALDLSEGVFTAVMDDDDIMPPWRLEASLASIGPGEHGTVGSFVTFSDVSGELMSWADPLPTMRGANVAGGFAGHPTWMIRTDVLRSFRYDPSFTSSVDHNIATRMVRSGIKLSHSNRVLNLRRTHALQVTARDSRFQGRGARLGVRWLRDGLTASEARGLAKADREVAMSQVPGASERESIVPYLPDHLVDRSLLVQVDSEEALEWVRSRFEVYTGGTVNAPDQIVGILWLGHVSWKCAADLASHEGVTVLEWQATPTPNADGASRGPDPARLSEFLANLVSILEGKPNATATFDIEHESYAISPLPDDLPNGAVRITIENR